MPSNICSASSNAAAARDPFHLSRIGLTIILLPSILTPFAPTLPAAFVAATAALGTKIPGSATCAALPTISAPLARREAPAALPAMPTPFAAAPTPPANSPPASSGRSCKPRPVNSYSSPTLSKPAIPAMPSPNCAATRLFSGLMSVPNAISAAPAAPRSMPSPVSNGLVTAVAMSPTT